MKFEKGVNVMEAFTLLPDPQTNGGLLIAVNASGEKKVTELFNASGLRDLVAPVGKMIRQEEKIILVRN